MCRYKLTCALAGARTGRYLVVLLASATLAHGGCVRRLSSHGALHQEASDLGWHADRGQAPDNGCYPAWRCQKWTLEVPEAVAELNTPDMEEGPIVSPDCLTIRFSSTRPGGQGGSDVWSARRQTPAAAFGDVTNEATFNTSADEWSLLFSADGLWAFVATTRPGGTGGADIWVAQRPSASASFGAPAPDVAINSPEHEFNPFLSADGLRLYFTSHRSGRSDNWIASRGSSDAPFGEPQPIVELGSPAGDQASPTLSSDERLIIFGRVGPSGTQEDLWYALRETREAPFGAPQRLPVVNDGSWNQNSMLACGDAELWFASNRARPTGSDITGSLDIYRTRFVPAP